MNTARVSTLSAVIAAAFFGTIIISLVSAFAFASEALAASYIVTSSGDAHDAHPGDQRCAAASGLCTLRAAIEEANASRAPDSIGFRLERGATITLRLGQLRIAGASMVRIEGPGAGLLSLDGNGASRLIRVAPDATAYISGLTLRNGYVDFNKFGDRAFGAGLENAGMATLRNVVIRGNRAPQGGGGIVNGGVMSIIGSRVSGNSARGFAGGILNTGSLFVADSLISGNSAPAGAGGIDNRGTATLSGTIVRGNASERHAGGIASRGTLYLIGSTISGNSGNEGAGGIENFGSLSLYNSKVTQNRSKLSGGIAGTRGGVKIAYSLIAGNSGNSGSSDANADCWLSPVSAFSSGGHNRFGDGTGCVPGALDSVAAPSADASVPPDTTAIAAATASLNIRVAASADDAEEKASGSINLTSTDLELVFDGSDQKIGMRFNGVAVPRNATITNAWIQFTVDEVQSVATTLLIQGQDADNAAAFTTASGNVSTRTRTGAGVLWSPANWSTIGQAVSTPNLAPVVQQIVNRPGWSSGNSMAILISGTGHRTADSYDGAHSTAPLLHIEYQTTSPGNLAPVVNAGSDKTITLPSGVTLSGSVSDDGLPIPPAVTCAWTTASGPASAAFGNATSTTSTATFPSSGTYNLRLTCSDGSLSASDDVKITVNATGGGSNVAVYTGYYDTHHPNILHAKPNPWQGASGAVFVGTSDTSSGGWDSSAIRVDNLTSSTLASVVVTVDIGSRHFALWGTRSIPAGQSLILAQTSFENYDGSDLNSAGCYSCNPSLCTSAISATIPVVHVNVGGTTINSNDLGQILNTHGVDSAGCPYTGTRNDESENWQRIH